MTRQETQQENNDVDILMFCIYDVRQCITAVGRLRFRVL